jgi:beta-xylosidase
MNKTITFLILCLIGIFNTYGQQQDFFGNPVIHGDVADPSIIRVGDEYFATGTSSEWAPFYPVFTSKDLVNWKQVGHIFDKQPEWTSNSFWAPELYHHKNGKIYCYYTARSKSNNISYIGVATADTPTGKYTDHGLLIEFGTEAIDAFVYDDNGQLYITWKAYGLDKRPIEIVGSKLSEDGLKLEGEVFSLLTDTEKIGMEGQYHFKHNDYYYMIYAAHGCCGPNSDYDVYVARAKSFEGPYEKYEGNPILYSGGGSFLSVGHGTGVTTPDGRTFYMCHAYLRGDGFYMGRQPVLHEIIMGEDNWPHITTGNVAQIKQPVPFVGTIQESTPDFEDKFKSDELKVDWTWNYALANVSIELKKGKLLLSGTPKGNNIKGNALCLRPTSTHYTYETIVTNNNKSLKGLTMYGDDKNFVAWGCEDNQLVLKLVKDGNETILYQEPTSAKKEYFKIEVEKGRELSFYGSKDGKKWTKIIDSAMGSTDMVRWDRIARPGLIHAGRYTQPAEFSYFKLTNIR